MKITRVFMLLLLGILLMPGFACGAESDADYKVGYTEGWVTAKCDCRYLKGEIDMDTYLDCIPEETKDLDEGESYSDDYLQGFGDAYDAYGCDWWLQN